MGGAIVLAATTDVNRIEAPVTKKAYMICAFAAFGGILFGYDIGYIAGVLNMPYFIHQFTGLPIPGPDASAAEKANFVIPADKTSLVVSILSAGTFFGSVIAGDFADWIGRRTTIIAGCGIFAVGVVLQVASTEYNLLVAGRLVAGVGVGFLSAIVILYMSEIAPKKVRGAVVSAYQFCLTFGILVASCVTYASAKRHDTGCYRIPFAVQFVWALVLGVGLSFLPESPRYYVKRGNLEKATRSLARLRGQPIVSEYIQQELAEIVANNEYEMRIIGENPGYLRSWLNCFSGSIFDGKSNIRRTFVGSNAQTLQQWTGINFIFYYGTVFFQQLGVIDDPFLISLVTTLVNVCSTPVSFWAVERFGRRPLLICGAIGMVVSQFIIAIAGTVDGANPTTVKAQIAFICVYIFFFASTWGPGCWVVVGEMFSLPIRARGVAISVASNWFWNCIIAVITPYMVSPDKGNMGSRVFFVWGSLNCICLAWAYSCVYETKGLSLEQVDSLLEESTPRKSSKWVPTKTFAAEIGVNEKGELQEEVIEHIERRASMQSERRPSMVRSVRRGSDAGSQV